MQSKNSDNLHPSCQWDSRKGSKAVGNVLELDILGSGKESRKVIVLLNESADGGSHGDTAVLHLDSAVTSKVLFGTSVWTILDESQRTVSGGICEDECEYDNLCT